MYYLVDAAWWLMWSDYVGFEDGSEARGSRPNEIDNSSLLAPGSTAKLRPYINEGRDHVFVLHDEWELLRAWYGGGPALPRRGITQGSTAVVELYGLTLKVYRSSDLSAAPVEMNISKAATVRELKEMACKEFGVVGAEVKIWDYFQKKPYALLDTPSKQLEQCQIMENNDMLVEEKDAEGKFNLKKNEGVGVGSSSTYSSGGNQNVVTSTAPPSQKGVVGLQNLGNTCFMNSTLQCLSNTPPLREFFASGDYEAEINNDNPLGHEGKLAGSFGSLMKMMWPQGDEAISAVAPRGFKYQMGTSNPMFAGFQQHDSSELMNFLLDGLHEDLNRIQDKPYVESTESDGRPDDVVAKEAMDNYKLRNDSQIHDLFRGQFKSTLVCPSCGNVSITFDPYTMISLPLRTAQEEMQQSYSVKMVYYDAADSKWVKNNLTVSIPKGAEAGQLRAALSTATSIPVERIVIGQILRSYIYKFFDDSASLDFVKTGTSTIIAYDVEYPKAFEYDEQPRSAYSRRAAAEPPKVDKAAMVLYFRKEESVTSTYITSSYNRTMKALYGDPLLFCHPKETSPNELYNAIADLLGKDKVNPEMFQIRVADAFGKPTDNHVVDRADMKPVTHGLKPKLHLVVEWVDWAKEQIQGMDGVQGKDEPEGVSGATPPSPGGAASAADENDDGYEDGKLHLKQCLELFSTEEKLSPEDAWYCSKCQQHVEATKKMELWSTPKVLVLHLKRFSYSRYYRDKLETPVNFPLDDLDLSPYVLEEPQSENGQPAQPPIYDCVGVSNHMGSLGGGHYTACGRSSEDGQWYKFNDSHTSPMQPQGVASGDAYLLFYVRRDLARAYLPVPQNVEE
mmetsp:Transcript_6718/g.13802  ORF Transcript_6718/g.13802 Transcript_6718/m.13802 type:complete len:847 (+) Transcript_6718:160-2700(+)